MPCDHQAFKAEVNVLRKKDNEEDVDVKNWSVEITIQCDVCDRKFRFLGLPVGVDPEEPTVSADGLEARIPIVPSK